ncbi:MAG: hypothetical protein SVV03_02915 [Candidatus Nanohaloarchaea archaeon]|nr:hypothetical protein [Candidatus Nanohaloarchaea archaeon]
MELKYYDITEAQEPLFENGSSVSISELIEAAYQDDPEVFDEEGYFAPDTDFDSIEPEPYQGRKEWKKMMETLIYSLSGQNPSDREENLALSATEELRQYYKETELYDDVTSREFMFGTLPYLFAGFGVKDQKWSRNDVNNKYSFLSFTDNLLRREELSSTSFLCAHKKQREEEKHSLTESIDTEGVGRTFNLLRGVFGNAGVSHTEINLYQPGKSYEGIISIFPGIIVETSKREELNEIKRRLEVQMDQMEELCEEYSEDFIDFHVDDVDDHVSNVFEEAKRRWSSDYQTISTEELEKISKEDNVAKIALDHTLPEIERLMPYYKEPGSMEPIIERDKLESIEDEEIKKALGFYTGPMSAAGKAALETLFYAVWGQNTKERDEMTIGLERDHEDYQTIAFHIGYGGGYHMAHFGPQMYARRNNKTEIGGTLHKTSFRQFWR